MIEVRKATYEDGISILSNLRYHEARTIEKLRVNAPELLAKVLRTEFPSFTYLIDDEPAAIFGGYSETMLGECRLWMLTTPLIEKNPIFFLRASRRFIKWMADTYGPVTGMVDSEFEKSRNWLRWLGFKEVQQGEYIVMRYTSGH